MPVIIGLLLLGAGVGYAAATYMNLRIPRHTAILAGAFGGLIGGMGLKLLLSAFGALIGALFGAALIVFLAQAMTRR